MSRFSQIYSLFMRDRREFLQLANKRSLFSEQHESISAGAVEVAGVVVVDCVLATAAELMVLLDLPLTTISYPFVYFCLCFTWLLFIPSGGCCSSHS